MMVVFEGQSATSPNPIETQVYAAEVNGTELT